MRAGREVVGFGISHLAEASAQTDVYKRLGRARRTRVLSDDSAARAGLTLIRVLPKGLWSSECFSRTEAEPTQRAETTSRTLSGILKRLTDDRPHELRDAGRLAR